MQELDSNWDCTEEYMAATLHPYDPTAGAKVPKLVGQVHQELAAAWFVSMSACINTHV